MRLPGRCRTASKRELAACVHSVGYVKWPLGYTKRFKKQIQKEIARPLRGRENPFAGVIDGPVARALFIYISASCVNIDKHQGYCYIVSRRSHSPPSDCLAFFFLAGFCSLCYYLSSTRAPLGHCYIVVPAGVRTGTADTLVCSYFAVPLHSNIPASLMHHMGNCQRPSSPAGTRCICPIRQRYYPRAIEAQPRQEGRATAIPLPLLLTFFLLLVLFLFFLSLSSSFWVIALLVRKCISLFVAGSEDPGHPRSAFTAWPLSQIALHSFTAW